MKPNSTKVGVNKMSSSTQKREVADVVYSQLMDYFFDKVVFLNLAYSDLGSGGTTSTTNYGKASRIIDSSGGQLMRPGRDSRFRCQFYLKNPSKMEGYILSPAVFDSFDSSIITTSLSTLRSYVGIKIYQSTLYAVVKQANKAEELTALDFDLTMYDATFSDTFALEIRHNVTSTDILINNVNYGSYSTDLVGTTSDVYTFYPFFSPARSTDGTQVNIVAENVQFIQNKV
jgi:hypothetical protein